MTAAPELAVPAGGLVVFDFDHTIYRGDSGTGLISWMLRRNPLRLTIALLVGPLVAPLFLWQSSRRLAISFFLWIATFGLHRRGDLDALIARYVVVRADALRARLLPAALEMLGAHRSAGDAVVVATGTSPALASAILGFVAHADVAVVGSRSESFLGGMTTVHHCHGENKLRMLREAGFDAPIVRAYSDSTADLPLLRAAREPVVVNPRPHRVAVFRRALGNAVPVLDWGGR